MIAIDRCLFYADIPFNPIQDGPFRGFSRVGFAKRPPSLKSVTRILQ